jgi:hypothetical protein
MNYSLHIFEKIMTATVRKFIPIQIWEHIFNDGGDLNTPYIQYCTGLYQILRPALKG